MRIGLDIDYVLINFDEGVYDYYDKQYVEKVARDTFIDEIYEELRHNKEFYLKLKPRINPIYIDFPFECYITARDINPYITYMKIPNLSTYRRPRTVQRFRPLR